MVTIHRLSDEAHPMARRAVLSLSAVGALLLTACGSSAAPASSSGVTASTPTPTATPAPTSTPGPSNVQATLTGDPAVSGTLVMGSVHFVTCDEPSLTGPSILAFRTAADPTVGVLLTIRQGSIDVRLARGSGATYTERLFEGTGVSSFDPAAGAQFSSTLTDSTPAGTHTGTLGAITSISGSVSCGTFRPGTASVTVAGTTAGGAIGGPLTTVRVLCGGSGGDMFATVTGLSQVGSMPALVSVDGGTGGSPLFITAQTASATYQYSSSAAGSVTVTSSGATYNASVTPTTASSGTTTLMVSGSATCGVSS